MVLYVGICNKRTELHCCLVARGMGGGGGVGGGGVVHTFFIGCTPSPATGLVGLDLI